MSHSQIISMRSYEQSSQNKVPTPGTRALLIQGVNRIVCRIEHASTDVFTIIAPRSKSINTDAAARLLIEEAIHTVVTTAQMELGHEVRLTFKRCESPNRASSRSSRSWSKLGSMAIAAAIALAILFFPTLQTRNNEMDASSRSNWQVAQAAVSNVWKWTSNLWSPAEFDKADVQQLARNDRSDSRAKLNPTKSAPNSASPWKSEKSSGNESDKAKLAKYDDVEPEGKTLKSALSAAQSGRSHPLNESTVPWLFSTNDQRSNGLHHCRMSDAASGDLRTFDQGLKSLPAVEANEAKSELAQALSRISNEPASVPVMSQVPGVRMYAYQDAAVYFRIVDGETEILRVLPAEVIGDSPFGITTDSVRRTAAHR